MLNTIGSLIGFGLAKLVVRYLPSLDEKRREVQEVSISYMRRAVAFLVDFIMLVLLNDRIELGFLLCGALKRVIADFLLHLS